MVGEIMYACKVVKNMRSKGINEKLYPIANQNVSGMVIEFYFFNQD